MQLCFGHKFIRWWRVIKEIAQDYNSHPSMIKVREKFDNSQNKGKFQFNSVTTPEILKLFKNIDAKKGAGNDKMPLN